MSCLTAQCPGALTCQTHSSAAVGAGKLQETPVLYGQAGWKDEAAACYTHLRGSDPGQAQLSLSRREADRHQPTGTAIRALACA